MRRALTTVLLGLLAIFFTGAIAKADNPYQLASDKENVYFNEYSQDQGRSINFNDNWKFNLGDVSGADQEKFDDSAWESVNLPHDYSIDQDYSNQGEQESGFKLGGIGWYRKTFTLKNFDSNKDSVRVDFDGVYMDSTVYVNGERLGNHPYGYTPFSYDVTPFVRNGENTIAVKVNHQTPSSRWYSGSGIYRDVHLTMTNDVHVDLFGSKFDTHDLATEMATENKSVTVFGSTNVKNNSSEEVTAKVKYELYEKNNSKTAVASSEEATVTIPSKQTKTVTKDFEVVNPKLWDTVNPNMYTVRTIVSVDNQVVDTYDTDFGFRYYAFDANKGFSLNGKNIKLQGVCMHHDQGPLGAVASKDAQERQIQILKEMGVNSIRVTHNPASQTLIDLCNEYGILVVEEAFDGWHVTKNGNSNDYARFFDANVGSSNERLIGSNSKMKWSEFDLKMMIERGYSAPSIIVWSLGNEVQYSGSGFVDKNNELINYAKKYDIYRPTTIGDDQLKNGNSNSITMANNSTTNNGLVGFNYASGEQLDKYHSEHPTWKIYGSETSSSINSRGVYNKPYVFGNADKESNLDNQLTSYDTSKVAWGHYSSESMYYTLTRDYMAGEYVWTGFDYLGEPTPWNGTTQGAGFSGNAPKSSFFGIVDTAGMPKDRYYFYQSQWAPEKNTLHVLPTWNRDSIKINSDGKVPVVVYSSAAKVEVWLNGKKVDEDTMKPFKSNTQMYTFMARNEGKSHKDLYYEFNIPYEEGTLEVKAFDAEGKQITNTSGRNIVKTTGDEYKLQAKTNKTEITADGKSLAYIQVDVVDENGNIVPDAKNLITANVTGTGTFKVMDNGKQADHTKYTVNSREAYNGSVVVVVESKQEAGTMTVDLSAEGLDGCKVEIKTVGDTSSKTVVGANMSKYYYLKAGTNLSLPSTVDLLYSDGTKEPTKVTWNTEGKDFSKPGVYNVEGTVEGGYKVSVVLNVIDKIGGMYNYSTYTQKGITPTLPNKLPVYDQNGEQMNLNLDVEWQMPDKKAFDRYGVVQIKGKAEMFGQQIEVYANVDVKKPTLEYGDNTAGQVSKLSQDIPENLQSDNLNAIIDGQTNTTTDYEGSLWSNYDASQAGDKDAIITFNMPTQQNYGKIIIYFVEDAWSLVAPKKGTTKIEFSDDGVNWEPIHFIETIGEKTDVHNKKIVPYTYEFDATLTTNVRFTLYCNEEASNVQHSSSVGISEIQMFEVSNNYNVGTDAKLSYLNINGYTLNQTELEKQIFKTETNDANIKATGKDNASVTVLPQVGEYININIVSEDGLTNNTFSIELGALPSFNPDDSSGDISDITFISAPESQSGFEIDKAKDNIENTWYHSKYDTNLNISAENPGVIIFTIPKQEIRGIRYLSRNEKGNSESNGRIGEVEILVSSEKATNKETDIKYETVYQGVWADTDGWKMAEFEPIEVQTVKILVKSTYANVEDKKNNFISAIEFDAVGLTVGKEDLSSATVSVEPVIINNNQPDVLVTLNSKELIRNVDYTVSYQNNKDNDNNSNIIITGINKYKGTITRDFNTATDITITSVKVKNNPQLLYSIGQFFDPTGLILEVTYSDNSKFTHRYTGYNVSRFNFDVEEYLVQGDSKIKGTFDGVEFVLDVYTTFGESYQTLDDALLGLAKVYNEDEKKYTKDSFEKFKEAYESALAAKDDSSSDKDAARLNLIEAYDELVKFANTKALKDLVTKLEDTTSWTISTKAAYDALIAEAKALLESELTENDQAKVDELVVKINEAIANKKIKATNVTEFNELINENKNKDEYTAESWAVYEKALKDAKSKDVADLTQDEVDALVKTLKDAKNNLVLQNTATSSNMGLTVGLGLLCTALSIATVVVIIKITRNKRKMINE